MPTQIEKINEELARLRALVEKAPNEPKKETEVHNSVQDVRKNTGETDTKKVEVDSKKPSDMSEYEKEVEDLRKKVSDYEKENLTLRTKAAVKQEITKPDNVIDREGLVGIEEDIGNTVKTMLFGKQKVNTNGKK